MEGPGTQQGKWEKPSTEARVPHHLVHRCNMKNNLTRLASRMVITRGYNGSGREDTGKMLVQRARNDREQSTQAVVPIIVNEDTSWKFWKNQCCSHYKNDHYLKRSISWLATFNHFMVSSNFNSWCRWWMQTISCQVFKICTSFICFKGVSAGERQKPCICWLIPQVSTTGPGEVRLKLVSTTSIWLFCKDSRDPSTWLSQVTWSEGGIAEQSAFKLAPVTSSLHHKSHPYIIKIEKNIDIGWTNFNIFHIYRFNSIMISPTLPFLLLLKVISLMNKLKVAVRINSLLLWKLLWGHPTPASNRCYPQCSF